MALVGEIILGSRELFTDLPIGRLNPPSGLTAAAFGSGATIPSGTYDVEVTYSNQFGETLAEDLGAVVITLGQAIRVTGSLPPGVTKVRMYFSLANLTPGYLDGTSLPLTATASGIPGSVPVRNTAYLPDTDGNALSVSGWYRWLNDGLNLASTICDGLPDFAAVGTDSGQPAYVFPGTWNKVGLCWYDGYPVAVDSKNNVFRRNNIPGIVGNLSLIQSTDRLIVECWPQPSRTSGRTTTTANMSATDSSVTLAASNFVIGFGLAQIGDELVYFAQNGSLTMSGLTRGMAGTIPTAWPSGTAVTELNLMVTGTRAPRGYSVGMAGSTFYLPPGWEDAIQTYLISRFRKGEQQTQEAQALLNEFTAKVQKLSATKIIAGPRQIPSSRGSGVEIAGNMGSIFGGVIIP